MKLIQVLVLASSAWALSLQSVTNSGSALVKRDPGKTSSSRYDELNGTGEFANEDEDHIGSGTDSWDDEDLTRKMNKKGGKKSWRDSLPKLGRSSNGRKTKSADEFSKSTSQKSSKPKTSKGEETKSGKAQKGFGKGKQPQGKQKIPEYDAEDTGLAYDSKPAAKKKGLLGRAGDFFKKFSLGNIRKGLGSKASSAVKSKQPTIPADSFQQNSVGKSNKKSNQPNRDGSKTREANGANMKKPLKTLRNSQSSSSGSQGKPLPVPPTNKFGARNEDSSKRKQPILSATAQSQQTRKEKEINTQQKKKDLAKQILEQRMNLQTSPSLKGKGGKKVRKGSRMTSTSYGTPTKTAYDVEEEDDDEYGYGY